VSEDFMMKRSFLVAGSLGLVGLATQAIPASAQQTSVNGLMNAAKQDAVGQVTSVSQLSDVQPTDWAFQALQSLVERYGCIAGYPNGTFRGNRAATRYELAAALNACLDQISDKFATKEDLATVKALQEEFKAELATLKGRVDGLEARTATLEAQQFSTTTKLQGEVVMAVQYGDRLNTRQADNGRPSANSRASALARVRLNFNTSFTGKDLLQTQLEVGNGGRDFAGTVVNDGATGQGNVPLYDSGTIDYQTGDNTVRLRRLAYSFKPAKNFTVTIGPRVFPSDFVDFNSYANNSAQDFSSGFFINNPLIIDDVVDTFGGAGAAVDWKIGGGPFTVRAAYVAASPTNSTAAGANLDGNLIPTGGGLFGDPNQGTVELEYAKPFGAEKKNNFAVRLQYTNSNSLDFHQNVLGLNTEATFGRFGVFGRVGYSINPRLGNSRVSAASVGGGAGNVDYYLSWSVGAGVKDLLVPGSLLAVAGGQPLVVNKQPGPEQFNFEGFYRFPINDNITITPAVMVITDPNNARNDAVIQGLVRATFSF
jgi:hypothetical protein